MFPKPNPVQLQIKISFFLAFEQAETKENNLLLVNLCIFENLKYGKDSHLLVCGRAPAL